MNRTTSLNRHRWPNDASGARGEWEDGPCFRPVPSPSRSVVGSPLPTPRSRCAPATRSGWSVATAPARRASSPCSQATPIRRAAWSCARTHSATSPRTPAPRATPRRPSPTCSRDAISTRRRAGSRPCAPRWTRTRRSATWRFARAEDRFRDEGGYGADSEARRLAHGLGLPDDRLDLPLTALSGGERRRVELARILFAGQRAAAPRRADQPPRHRREAVADGVPPLVPRLDAGREPRPRAPRRGNHARDASRRRSDHGVPGHVLAVPEGARPTRCGSSASSPSRTPR